MLHKRRHQHNSRTPCHTTIIHTRRPVRTATATIISQHSKVRLAAIRQTTWHTSDPMACNWSTGLWILVWTPTNICHCKMKIIRTKFDVPKFELNWMSRINRSEYFHLIFYLRHFCYFLCMFIVSVLFIDNKCIHRKKKSPTLLSHQLFDLTTHYYDTHYTHMNLYISRECSTEMFLKSRKRIII